jgi:hypothetical protein
MVSKESKINSFNHGKLLVLPGGYLGYSHNDGNTATQKLSARFVEGIGTTVLLMAQALLI